MERRKFLGLGVALFAASVVPASLMAEDFRKSKPNAWTTKNPADKKGESLDGVNAAIKELFGTDKVEVGNVKLKAPDIAENGAVIPVTVKSDKATKIAIFQSANPEALVAVFDVPKNGIPDYSMRIKMSQTGTVVAVAQIDGKLYKAEKVVKVTIGGCGG